MDCNLCSVVGFIVRCGVYLASCLFDYPLLVFLLSFIITLVLMTNIESSMLASGLRVPVCHIQARCMSSRAAACPPPSPVRAPVTFASPSSYDYSETRGPHTWNQEENSNCNQSPINIMTECVQKLHIRELLTWNHYDDLPCCVWLENNGHTVILRASFAGNTPTISGADLLASYTFVELCFRWSHLNGEGSEHMINYKKFPLEMQVMHRTGPTEESTSSYDLLLLTYFFEISAHNPYMDPLVQNLHLVYQPNSKAEIAPFPLAYLCHQFRNNFYSYGGSLTEPPCYQGAEWFVFPEALAISERQLAGFRQLLGRDGCTPILRNARPVQEVNEARTICYNQYLPADCTFEGQDNEEDASECDTSLLC